MGTIPVESVIPPTEAPVAPKGDSSAMAAAAAAAVVTQRGSETGVAAPEEKSGIGVIGGTVAVAGGLGLGAVADNLVVSHNIKSNWATPYAEATKAAFEREKESMLQRLQRGTDANAIGADAWQLFETTRHEAFAAVQASDNVHIVATKNPETVLGAASKAFKDKHPWIRGHAGAKYWEDLQNPIIEKFNAQAQKIAAATGDAKTAAANELLNMFLPEAEKFDRAVAASKVKEISWLRRLNPFGELHLSGGQKTLAVAAGTVTAAVSAIAIGMTAKWMIGSDKGKDSGREA